MAEWTTSDYFNILPAFQVGARLSGQLAEQALAEKRLAIERAEREARDRLAAAAEKRAAAAETRYGEEAALNRAQTLAQWGVAPIFTGGKFDPAATAQEAIKERDRQATAKAMAEQRLGGVEGPLPVGVEGSRAFQSTLAAGQLKQAEEDRAQKRAIELAKVREGLSAGDILGLDVPPVIDPTTGQIDPLATRQALQTKREQDVRAAALASQDVFGPPPPEGPPTAEEAALRQTPAFLKGKALGQEKLRGEQLAHPGTGKYTVTTVDLDGNRTTYAFPTLKEAQDFKGAQPETQTGVRGKAITKYKEALDQLQLRQSRGMSAGLSRDGDGNPVVGEAPMFIKTAGRYAGAKDAQGYATMRKILQDELNEIESVGAPEAPQEGAAAADLGLPPGTNAPPAVGTNVVMSAEELRRRAAAARAGAVPAGRP